MARMNWERRFRNYGPPLPLDGLELEAARERKRRRRSDPLRHFELVRRKIAAASRSRGRTITSGSMEAEIADAVALAMKEVRGTAAAKRHEPRIDAEARRLRARLRRLPGTTQALTPSVFGSRRVLAGDLVDVASGSEGRPRRYVVASTRVSVQNHVVVSPQSPVGRALLGAAVGEVVMVMAPAGPRPLRIISIETAPDS